MQRHFYENLSKLYQIMSKSAAELTELNIHTFNQFAKNSGYLGELEHMKKPEEVFWTQMKLLGNSQVESLNYSKKMSDIWIRAMDEYSEFFNDVLRETTIKTPKDKNKD